MASYPAIKPNLRLVPEVRLSVRAYQRSGSGQRFGILRRPEVRLGRRSGSAGGRNSTFVLTLPRCIARGDDSQFRGAPSSFSASSASECVIVRFISKFLNGLPALAHSPPACPPPSSDERAIIKSVWQSLIKSNLFKVSSVHYSFHPSLPRDEHTQLLGRVILR